MVEADIHLRLLPASILGIYNVFEALERSGQPDMAGSYEKALATRKLLNVKDTHSNRLLYGRTTQLLAQIEKLLRQRLCSSLECIIEAKSN
jgi:hypothetical protein